jgi:hypothetical protein
VKIAKWDWKNPDYGGAWDQRLENLDPLNAMPEAEFESLKNFYRLPMRRVGHRYTSILGAFRSPPGASFSLGSLLTAVPLKRRQTGGQSGGLS